MRVLVVEDEASLADVIRRGLSREGFVVDVMYDGQDGLWAASESAYDVIGLDIMLPVLDGYQRENKRHSVVAVGCTGGKHRSVVMARELAARLADVPGVAVRVAHRDLGRE